MSPPDAHHFLRQRIRTLLLACLGGLLLCIVGFGFYANTSLEELGRRDSADLRRFLRRTELLEQAFTLLSDQTAESSEPERVAEAIRRYRQDAPVSLTGLDAALTAYLAEPKLPAAHRSLLEALVRTGFEDRRRSLAAAGEAEEIAQRVEQRLWIGVLLAGLAAVLVVVLAFRHFWTLERAAEVEHEAVVKARAELEGLSMRLLHSQDEERRRIARDLHDDVGQRLAGLLYELAGAAERTDASPEIRQALTASSERLGEVARDLQLMSRNLHSAVLEKIGLVTAVRAECETLRQRTSLDVQFSAENVPRKVPEALGLALYRVFQECVQNSLKHSQTARLDVTLRVAEGELVLRVEDFGVGFQPYTAAGGMGLMSMRERLRALEGVLAIRSAPGSGTEVVARVPLAGLS